MTLSNRESNRESNVESNEESNTDSQVSWRLNDLIQAGQKAKAFAAIDWYKKDLPETQNSFELWTPTVVNDPSATAALVNQPSDEPDESTPLVEESAEELEGDVIAEDETADSTDATAEQDPEADLESAKIDQAVLEQARADSFDQGYQQAMAEAEEKWSSAREDFIALTDSLRSAQSDKNDFYQPLKKLALHLAEQLVRGELTLSTAAIERLVDEAIKDIEQQGEGPIVVSLSPDDHQRFTAHLSSDLDQVELRIDASLQQGSVKISMDDSAIEDLMENRLASMAVDLLGLSGKTYSSGSNSASSSTSATSNRNQRAKGAASRFVNNVDESVIEGSAEEIAGTELDGEPDDLGRSQPQPQPSAAAADSLEPTEKPLPDA